MRKVNEMGQMMNLPEPAKNKHALEQSREHLLTGENALTSVMSRFISVTPMQLWGDIG
jgi:ribosomal 50S subunit-associated protein YjgA (DUF615 family)